MLVVLVLIQGFFFAPHISEAKTPQNSLTALSLVHITLFDKVISFVEHLFSFPLPTFKAKTTIASPKEVALSSKPLVVSSSFPVSRTAVYSSPTNSLSPSSPSSLSPLIFQLSTTLSSLEAKLKKDLAKASEIYLPQIIYLPSQPQPSPVSSGGTTVVYQTDPSVQGQIASLRDMIAATGKIDKLANTIITTPAITGGSFTDVSASGSFSGTFSGTTATLTTLIVSGTATSTVSGDVAFDTNTLTVDSLNNRVGVGTSSPSDVLAVNGPIFLANISAPTVPTSRLYATAGSLYWNGIALGAGGGAETNWSFFNGSGIKLSTTSNQVLIGASATSTTSNLEVIGTGYFSGNVGFATTSPYTKLSVEGSSALGASALAGYFVATSSTGSRFTGALGASSTLAVSGLETQYSGFVSLASSSVNNDLTVTGNLFVRGTPTYTGTGTTTFAGAIQTTGLAATTYLETPFIRATSTTATSTLSGNLDVLGKAVFGDFLTASRFNATSTTATSTFNGGLSVGGGGGTNGLNLTGHLLFPTDNAYDIGASGANRPRNIYAATSIAVPAGTVTATNFNGNGGTVALNPGYGGVAIGANTLVNWSSDATYYGSIDLGLSRISAGKIGVGTGSAGSVAGTLIANTIGIGTTSPYAKLSVVGPVVAEYFTATSTTATSTLSGNLDVLGKAVFGDFVSASRFNATSTTATSTFNGGFSVGGGTGTNGLNLTGHLLFPTDNVYDIGASAATRPRDIWVGRNVNVSGTVTSFNNASFQAAAAGYYYWTGLSSILSPADGVIRLADNAQTNFTRLQFGGTTAAFPAIGRSSNALVIQGANGENGARLGIGTSSPGALLAIEGTSTPRFPLFLVASTTSTSATSTAFIIDKDGKVGVGTSSPSSGLSVQGNILTSGALWVDGNVRVGSDTWTSSGITSGGGVSIGTGPGAPAIGQFNLYGSSVQKASLNTSGLTLKSDSNVNWTSTTDSQGTIDVTLARDTANTLALKNGVNYQTFNIYATSTDTSNYERLSIIATSTGFIFSAQSAGQGIPRNFNFSNTGAGGNVGIGTSSPWARLSVSATSTSATTPLFVVSSSTASASTTAFFIDSEGRVAVGTTTIVSPNTLTVHGSAQFDYLTATSTNATSTFVGNFGTLSGSFLSDTNGITTISSAALTNLNFDTDAGLVSWTDLPISSAPINTPQGYVASIGGNPLLSLYSISNNSAGGTNGGVDDLRVAIGTSTPYSRLSVWGVSTTTVASRGIFEVVDTASTTLFQIFNTGRAAFGTSSPYAQVSISGTTTPSSTGIPIFAVSTTTSGVDRVALVVANDGRIGIATATPWRSLSVSGTVSFQGITNDGSGNYVCLSANNELTYNGSACAGASSERFKHSIESIGGNGLEIVKKLRPVSFVYNTEKSPNDPSTHLGFIAEEVDKIMPDLVVYDKEGLPMSVKYNEFAPVIVKAIQELDIKMETLALGSGGAPLGSVVDIIKNGLLSIKEWAVDTITARKVKVTQGLEMTDAQTGEVYCVMIAGGEWNKVKGACADAHANDTQTGNSPAPAAGAGSSASSSPTLNPIPSTLNASLNASSTDLTPPVIILNGLNPTTLDFGTPYIDLGATITDNIDKNLGIHTTGAEIDTDIPGTYSVIYTAVDQAGNHATSTRSVVVKPKPSPLSTASSSPTLNPIPSSLQEPYTFRPEEQGSRSFGTSSVRSSTLNASSTATSTTH